MKAPNPESLKLIKEHGRKAITFGVACLPGHKRIFIGDSAFQVSEVEFTEKKLEEKELYKHESYVTSVTLAGETLVSGSYDGQLGWWDTVAGKPIRKSDAHSKWIRKVQSSPQGDIVASIADDMLCKLWDAKSGKLLHTLKGHEERTPQNFVSMLYAVAFSADGKYIATGDKVGHIVVWNVKTGEAIKTLESPGMYTWDPKARMHSIGGIRSLAFSPDGKRLIVGGIGKIGNVDHLEGKARLELFDLESAKSLAILESDKFKGLVNNLAYAPDGSFILAAGGAGEGFFLFADADGKKLIKQEKVSAHVHDLAISEDFQSIFAVTHNRVCHYQMG